MNKELRNLEATTVIANVASNGENLKPVWMLFSIAK